MSDPAVYRLLPSLSFLCSTMRKNPSTFLNCYLPLRIHPLTRQTVDHIIHKHRLALQSNINSDGGEKLLGEQPNAEADKEEDSFYYGIMFMDESVVTVFKNNQNIRVTPSDVNVILNFMKTN